MQIYIFIFTNIMKETCQKVSFILSAGGFNRTLAGLCQLPIYAD